MEKKSNNKKKPKFIRQDFNKKKSLTSKWRKPKGLHSKLRLKRAGHRKKISIGYGSPRKTRNLILGLKVKRINNIQDLLGIKKEGIIISSKLGDKKRIEILKKAQSQNIIVLNLNIEDKIKQITDRLEKKKNEKITKEKTRKQAKEESKKKAKEKKEESKEKTEGETKKELTKKLSEVKEHKKPDIKLKETHNAPKQMKITAPKQK